MAKRSETPIEERDYSTIYFVCSALLALTTFWAVLDMIWVRSPWQRTQVQFNKMEREQLVAKREELTAQMDHNAYAELEKNLAAAQAELQSEAYQKAIADSALVGREIADAVQAYRFAKSEADAEYYLFKEAQYHNDKDAYQQHGQKYRADSTKAVEWKAKWDDAEKRKLEIQTTLAGYRQKITDTRAQMAAMTKEIDDLSFRLDRIDARSIKIQQVVMTEFVKGNFQNFINNVDRCHTCHTAISRKGFEGLEQPFTTHPSLDTLLKIHPVERFGCTPCHDGQGSALQSVAFAHGEVKHWEHPLLRGPYAYAGCNKCHANELRTDHAPSLNKAKRMLVDLGCYGCHEIRGFENAERIGPSLARISQKLEPAWVYGWMRNNREFRAHTRMPNPMYTHEEALAATAYLYSVSEKDSWTPARMASQGNAANGETLIATVGCKACHVVTEEDRQARTNGLSYDVAPDLGVVGAKATPEWLFDWIKNPKRFAPETRMPNLRLSDKEAADIVAYLMQLSRNAALPENYKTSLPDLNDENLIKEGRAVVRNFGCHGCHAIPGMENEGRVSVSLNEFGAKTVEELFYGDALASGAVVKTWEGWTEGKLKNSRMYATEAVIQRMPNYQMSDEDATTMAVLLRSWDGRVIGDRYVKPFHGKDENIHKGRLLARQLNCTGCHIIEGEGGDITPTLISALQKEGLDETAASAYAPPNLLGEGQKVQSEWLFHFLKEPQTGQIRPWLRTRMPTFELSDQEANTLITYFKSLADEATGFTFLPNYQLTAEQRSGALQLVAPDNLACFSCHQQGSKKPEGPPDGWAPDLAMAKDRLDPNWIAAWIRDPQALMPGTRMPSFYPDSYPPHILDGDPEKQITALRNYLISLGQ